MDDTTKALLIKSRKLVAAGLTAKALATVCPLIGWTFEKGKQTNTVGVGGFKFIFSKRTSYELPKFLAANGFADAISKVLGIPTHAEEADFKRQFGTLKEADLYNAGTCQACFSVQQLDAKLGLVNHGYKRPGDVTIAVGVWASATEGSRSRRT
jgi:hypothetical protein